MVYQPSNLSISLGLNYPEFPDSCLGGEFLMVVKRYHIIIYGFENSGTVPEFCQMLVLQALAYRVVLF
jgi:hypothetical protein